MKVSLARGKLEDQARRVTPSQLREVGRVVENERCQFLRR